MAPNSRVLMFQDKTPLIEIASEVLAKDGHTVVGTAQTLDELIKLLKSEKIKPVDVTLIDNEAPGSEGEEPATVGPVAAKLIKEALPDAVQVAWTTTEHPGYGTHQYNSIKHGFSYMELGRFVTTLPAGSKESR